MKKDKLITIRVSAETRDKFNQWCETNQLKGSSFLSDIINGCINGIITPNLTSQSIDSMASRKITELENTVNYLSSQLNTLEESICNKLYKNIDSVVSQKVVELEEKVNSLSSVDNESKHKLAGLEDKVSNLESLYKKIDKSIEQPIIEETETVEKAELEEEKGTFKPYDSAIPKILELKAKGMTNRAIAKELSGKYYTKTSKTTWNHTVVGDIIKRGRTSEAVIGGNLGRNS